MSYLQRSAQRLAGERVREAVLRERLERRGEQLLLLLHVQGRKERLKDEQEKIGHGVDLGHLREGERAAL